MEGSSGGVPGSSELPMPSAEWWEHHWGGSITWAPPGEGDESVPLEWLWESGIPHQERLPDLGEALHTSADCNQVMPEAVR